jgi:hypothetical protein
MNIEFPLTPQAILTVVGIAVIAALVAQWAKHYLPDWRYTPLLVLGICAVLAALATWIELVHSEVGQRFYTAGLLALVGASLAVFGYETIVNLLGKAGVGPRSEANQERAARAALERVGLTVTESVARKATQR